MHLTDELQKLAELHAGGHLTAEEFAAAKRRLLAGTSAEASPEAPNVEPEFEERLFRSSRWSSGNKFFPDSLRVTNDGLLFRKGKLFGSGEEHIAYHAIASLKVSHGFFLSDVSVETSGGSQPIFLNGLWKSDAQEIQELVRAQLDRRSVLRTKS